MVLKQDFTNHFPKPNSVLKQQSVTKVRADVPLTHHRRGPISDLLILQVSQFTQDLGSRVLHLQQLQDGCSVVGDGHVLLNTDTTDHPPRLKRLLSRKRTVKKKGFGNDKRHTNPDVIHQHLVEANGSEGALDDVGDGRRGHD